METSCGRRKAKTLNQFLVIFELIFIVCIFAVTAFATVVDESKPDIRIYVSAGEVKADFVDPATRDSANDLRENLRKKRSLKVVDDQKIADVWIRVNRRFIQTSGSSNVLMTGSATGVATPINEAVILGTLIVGDYNLEMVGSHRISWKAAAGNLAKQLEKWVNENRSRLIERRTNP